MNNAAGDPRATTTQRQGDSEGSVSLDQTKFLAFVVSGVIWITGVSLGLSTGPALALIGVAYVLPSSLALALARERTPVMLAVLWGVRCCPAVRGDHPRCGLCGHRSGTSVRDAFLRCLDRHRLVAYALLHPARAHRPARSLEVLDYEHRESNGVHRERLNLRIPDCPFGDGFDVKVQLFHESPVSTARRGKSLGEAMRLYSPGSWHDVLGPGTSAPRRTHGDQRHRLADAPAGARSRQRPE